MKTFIFYSWFIIHLKILPIQYIHTFIHTIGYRQKVSNRSISLPSAFSSLSPSVLRKGHRSCHSKKKPLFHRAIMYNNRPGIIRISYSLYNDNKYIRRVLYALVLRGERWKWNYEKIQEQQCNDEVCNMQKKDRVIILIFTSGNEEIGKFISRKKCIYII